MVPENAGRLDQWLAAELRVSRSESGAKKASDIGWKIAQSICKA